MRQIIIANKLWKECGSDYYNSYDVKYSVPITTDWIEVSEEEFGLLVQYEHRLHYIVIEKCVRSVQEILLECKEQLAIDVKLAEKKAKAEELRKQKQLEKKKLSKNKELLLFEELKKKYGS